MLERKVNRLREGEKSKKDELIQIQKELRRGRCGTRGPALSLHESDNLRSDIHPTLYMMTDEISDSH